MAHHAVGGGADEIIAEIRRVRRDDDEVGLVLLGGGDDFTRGRAASDFLAALETGPGLDVRKLGLGVLDGVFDQVDRQVDRHIARQFLDNIDENDLAVRVQKRLGLFENLFPLVGGAEVYRYDDLLVHGCLLWLDPPFSVSG